MTEQKIRVGKRLLAAAEYVAVSSVKNSDGKKICADIGCDHGYLSIYLIEKGICDFVYASDINEKPVSIAKKNISARDTRGLGLSEKIEIRLGDGLSGLENKGINYVIICGMGGEVISGILDRCRDFWKNGVNFILQPMSSELERKTGFVLMMKSSCVTAEGYIRSCPYPIPEKNMSIHNPNSCSDKKIYKKAESFSLNCAEENSVMQGICSVSKRCRKKTKHLKGSFPSFSNP